MTIDIFILFLFLMSNLVFLTLYLHSRFSLTNSLNLIQELTLANSILQSGISANIEIDQNNIDKIHQDNFIKFLSDSRDWAFEYIENSQKIIKEVLVYLENKENDFDKIYAKKLKTLISEEKK